MAIDQLAMSTSSFSKMLAEDGHDDHVKFDWRMRHVFRGVPLAGKTVLDIGSGKGLTAIWIARQQASRVCSMEPELAGSRSRAAQVQEARLAELGLNNVDLVSDSFQEYQSQGRRFDVLFSESAINHLEESEHHALFHRPTFDSFVGIAEKFRELLSPGGVVVATDASRYGLFAVAKQLGVPPRYCYGRQTINYRLHQNPGTWRRVFRAAGFNRIAFSYQMPYALRQARPLLDNSLCSFCLQSTFILRAWA